LVRTIDTTKITDAVKDLCQQANVELPADVKDKLQASAKLETESVAQDTLSQLIENADIAAGERTPICQDTGLAVVFVELGQDLRLEGELLADAINEGVRQGYCQGYLRTSEVWDPLERTNTKDNTPTIIHTEIVAGDKIKLWVVPKGGGSENMSALTMLKPSDGWQGVKRFCLDVVSAAGANPCPPIIVGLGIGGNFEEVALIAKKALLRPLGETHSDKEYAAREKELLSDINKLGIGPAGLGGTTTALGVHIEARPCHIASLPVAVNIQCHAARHKEVTL